MKDRVPIKDNPNLVRDLHSGAVINRNIKEQKRILEQRAKKKNQSQEIENLKNDVKDIKDSLNKILEILGR